MPSLLVNADDLGLHPDIDRGIFDCIEAGRVQSVSFSPNGQTVDWKKLRDLQRQGVRVGLHVTLVGGPWLTDNRVVPGWKDLVKQLTFRGSTMKPAVESEIRRQFQHCQDNGLDPRTLSHVDSHQHVHAFTGIWQPCLAMQREYNIPRIRVPWCPSLKIIKKNTGGLALQWIARRRAHEVKSFLPCLGLAHAGHNTARIFATELSCASSTDTELVVHPGINTPALESKYHDWNFEWTLERDALLSSEFVDAVSRHGFSFPPGARSPATSS